MGWNAQPTCAVMFDNVKVPAANLLGEEGKGFNIAMNACKLCTCTLQHHLVQKSNLFSSSDISEDSHPCQAHTILDVLVKSSCWRGVGIMLQLCRFSCPVLSLMLFLAVNGGRINIASCSVGGAHFCTDAALEYVQGRQQFGRSIGTFQNTEFKLADMATAVHASRLMVRYTEYI